MNARPACVRGRLDYSRGPIDSEGGSGAVREEQLEHKMESKWEDAESEEESKLANGGDEDFLESKIAMLDQADFVAKQPVRASAAAPKKASISKVNVAKKYLMRGFRGK